MNDLACLWCDGRHSRLWSARLSLVDDGELAVVVDGAAGVEGDAGAGVGRWPLSQVRLSPRLGSAPRILRVPGGGSIEIADSPLLQQWFGRPPSRIEAAADWLERRRAVIAAAAAGVLALTIAVVTVGVPWTAERVAERIPPSTERQLSEQTLSLLHRMGMSPSALPARRQAQLRTEFAQLVAGEPRATQMRLELVRMPALGANAFALPDGRIYMTDALVALADSDDELLAVLAHEAGHHVYRHGMRLALEHSSVFLMAGLLLGDASGSSLTVALPAALLGSRFSRGHESQADAYAFALLRRHGRSPQAFADILRRLSAAQGGDAGHDGLTDYLASHPPTPARIRAAELAATE